MLFFIFLLPFTKCCCATEITDIPRKHLGPNEDEQYFRHQYEQSEERNQQHLYFLDENPSMNCNQELLSGNFSITSPNYPTRYGRNMDCVYRIRKSSPDVCELWVSFVNFKLENDPQCRYDYVEVGGQRYCGYGPPTGTTIQLPFDKAEITIGFHSDGTISDHGFHLAGYQKTGCSEYYAEKIREMTYPPKVARQNCTEDKSSKTFSIKSPNYPENYGHDMECLYKIRKFSPNVCQLRLTFVDFHLEKELHRCAYDYLEVQGQRYCGQGPGDVIQLDFKNQEILIRFHSDESTEETGFYITGQQKTNCSSSSKPRRANRSRLRSL